MITVSVGAVVALVFTLIIVAIVFALLFWLTKYVEQEWAATAQIMRVTRVVLVILAVLVLIGILLDLAGHPVLVLR